MSLVSKESDIKAEYNLPLVYRTTDFPFWHYGFNIGILSFFSKFNMPS